MSFLYPNMLWLLVLVLFMWIFLSMKSSFTTRSLFSAEVFEKLSKNTNTLSAHARITLFMLALVFVVLALAKPVSEKEKIKINEQAVDVIVALDISRSMEAKDLYPNRLVWAKKKIDDFLHRADGMRIGVMAFAQNSFVVVPITADREVASYLLNNLDNDSITERGTNIEQLIEAGAQQLENKTHKYMVLVTDGGDDKNYDKAIALAKKYKITLFVLGTGTAKGAPIQDENGGFIKQKGKIILTQFNTAIKQLALQTGGSFIQSIASKDDVNAMLHEIMAKTKKEDVAMREVKNYTQYFVYFLIGASVLLLYAFSSLPVRKKAMQSSAMVLLSFLALPVSSKAGLLDFQTIQQATTAYESKEYNKSIQSLSTLDTQDNAVLYNSANAYYKMKQYDKAIELYSKVDGNDSLKQQSLYNLGNAYAYTNKIDKAIQSYKDALALGEDKQIRENLEKLKKYQKKKKQKKKEQQKKNDKKKDKKNKQDKKQNNKKNDKKSKQSKKDQQKNGKSKEGEKKAGKKNDKKKQESKKTKQQKQAEKKKKEQAKKQQEQAKKAKDKKQKKQKAQQAQALDKNELSDKQEKKLMQQLQQHKGMTYRYQVGKPVQKEHYDKPW